MSALLQVAIRPYLISMPITKLAKGLICVGLGLGLANCAGSNPRHASPKNSEVGAFSNPKYGKASERVIADGQDVPKGGGRYQVGKPYSVAGRTYVPHEMNGKYTATGMASWYGEAFHGRKTANGEIYDKNSITAAHPTMPLPSYARVTNVSNGRSIIVRVNDRGPYHGGRVMDVSQRVAESLEFKHLGTARIKIDHLGPAGLAGSDDKKLLASLTTGQPAQLQDAVQQVQIASNDTTFAPAMVSTAPIYKAPIPKVSVPAASAIPQPIHEKVDIDGESDAVQAPVLAATSQTVETAPIQTLSEAVPLPPQRPYNLGTISAPVKTESAPTPVSQQQAVLPRMNGAGTNGVGTNGVGTNGTGLGLKTTLFYAEPENMRSKFAKNDPFKKLKSGNQIVKANTFSKTKVKGNLNSL